MTNQNTRPSRKWLALDSPPRVRTGGVRRVHRTGSCRRTRHPRPAHRGNVSATGGDCDTGVASPRDAQLPGRLLRLCFKIVCSRSLARSRLSSRLWWRTFRVGYSVVRAAGSSCFAAGAVGVSVLVPAVLRTDWRRNLWFRRCWLVVLAGPLRPTRSLGPSSNRTTAIDCASYASPLVVTAYAVDVDFYQDNGWHDWSVAGDYAFKIPGASKACLLYCGVGLVLTAGFWGFVRVSLERELVALHVHLHGVTRTELLPSRMVCKLVHAISRWMVLLRGRAPKVGS